MNPCQDFHRHFEKSINDTLVELPTRMLSNFLNRVRYRPCGLVRPRRGHRVESVRHSEDSGAQRNLLPSQFFRITGSVESLVMRQNQFCYFLEKGNLAHQIVADLDMG